MAVNYTNMTFKQLYDEVVMRMGKHRNAENADWYTILRFANRAVREVQARTLPYKDWAYIAEMNINNGLQLPWEFIKTVRVVLSQTGVQPYQEARYVDVREYYTTTNWQKQHMWNMATDRSPVYTLWGRTGTSAVTIYLAPNTLNLTGSAPSGYFYPTLDVRGKMEYYTAPVAMTGNASSVPVPYEYEELTVLSTLTRIFVKTGEADMLTATQGRLMIEERRVMEKFAEKERTEERQLDSFIEPVVPYIQAQPGPGEMEGEL